MCSCTLGEWGGDVFKMCLVSREEEALPLFGVRFSYSEQFVPAQKETNVLKMF